MEKEGSKITEEIEKKANNILEAHGFNRNGQPKEWDGGFRKLPERELIPEEMVN